MNDLISPALSAAQNMQYASQPTSVGNMSPGNLGALMAQEQVDDLLSKSAARQKTLADLQNNAITARDVYDEAQAERRADFVRTQQALRSQRPNYVDPQLMRDQVDWLSRSM